MMLVEPQPLRHNGPQPDAHHPLTIVRTADTPRKLADIVRLSIPLPAYLIKIGPHGMKIHRQIALYALTHIAGKTEYLPVILNPAVDGVQLPFVNQRPGHLIPRPHTSVLIEITHDIVTEFKMRHHKSRHVVDGPQHRLLPLLVAIHALIRR